MGSEIGDVTWLQWITVSFGMFALQLSWAIAYTFFSPSLLANGASAAVAGWAWMPSPLIQFILVPYLAYAADLKVGMARKSAWAQSSTPRRIFSPRSWFIAAMSGISILGSVVVLFSAIKMPQAAALVVISAGFLCVDIFNSVNDGLQRSLQSEMAASREERLRGHAVLTAFLSAGSAAGYATAAADWNAAAAAISIPASQPMLLALPIAAVVLLIGTTSQVATARLVVTNPNHNHSSDDETSLLQVEEEEGEEEEEEVRRKEGVEDDEAGGKSEEGLIERLRLAPIGVWWLCIAQVVAWLCLWPVWLFISSFFGEDVYGGNPASPIGSEQRNLFEEGVRRGSLAAGAMAIFAAITSPLLPPIVSRVGPYVVWVCALLLACVGLALAGAVKHRIASVLLVGLAGPAWAVLNAVVFASVRHILRLGGREQDLGLFSNIVFVAQTVPQLLAGATLGPLLQATQSGFTSTLYTASAAAFLAALFPALRTLDLTGADTRRM